ncbi:hypothetical protein Mp_3g16720 [Marchantia polymorpha subsp. ruderalis]|uniref:Uncharacterized protein n=2 Tax=Marchantia polymorpha TaxID=3197 RepID=A0AAF6B1K4_MARPO|nr:hypothetical protein MARPO_0039s0123 [Marchantia polymorpha]BBN05888.1 hypothetical protein Mp_3g16720 [Marchantia polymorpha subsp. ruderalis]|eukprot:PTQ40637.1 hypothetical protein MARPO_0039s0123 [Marchantia polymorpha]
MLRPHLQVLSGPCRSQTGLTESHGKEFRGSRWRFDAKGFHFFGAFLFKCGLCSSSLPSLPSIINLKAEYGLSQGRQCYRLFKGLCSRHRARGCCITFQRRFLLARTLESKKPGSKFNSASEVDWLPWRRNLDILRSLKQSTD